MKELLDMMYTTIKRAPDELFKLANEKFTGYVD